MKPSDFFFLMTKLYITDRNQFNKRTQNVINRYRQKHNLKEVRGFVQYVNRTYKNYKNPNRIDATRQFFTTLQEEAVPETTKPIFQMKRLV